MSGAAAGPKQARGKSTSESVSLGEELTIYQALDLYSELERRLHQGPALDLDLSAVREVDSAGLQVLIRLREMARAENKPMRLSRHSPAILEAFELFNLESLFGDPLVLPACGGNPR